MVIPHHILSHPPQNIKNSSNAYRPAYITITDGKDTIDSPFFFACERAAERGIVAFTENSRSHGSRGAIEGTSCGFQLYEELGAVEEADYEPGVAVSNCDSMFADGLTSLEGGRVVACIWGE